MQRVLEQRVTALLDKLLVKPSLVNLPPMEEGGLLLVSRLTMVLFLLVQIPGWTNDLILFFSFIFNLSFQYLRMVAVAYEKTQELARDLRAVGCGDLDVEGNEFNMLVLLDFT